MMVVTAHPDDEASSFGGSCVCIRNEASKPALSALRPDRRLLIAAAPATIRNCAPCGARNLPQLARYLKVSSGIVLDYPDGQLHRLDMQRVVSDLTLRIREFRPQVLLTFDPAGSVTGHTDHTMASVFATLAFHWAGRSNRFPDQLTGSVTPHRVQKLYHTLQTSLFLDDSRLVCPRQLRSSKIGQYLDTKIEAFRAHTSQQPLWSQFEEFARKRGERELFHLAASDKNGAGGIGERSVRGRQLKQSSVISRQSSAKPFDRAMRLADDRRPTTDDCYRALMISLSRSGFDSSRTR